MQLVVARNYEELSREAAGHIVRAIQGKPDLVLGLATGRTPVGLYRELVERFRRGEVDFSGVRTFNLDEYYPIDPAHPQSYRRFMEEHLFRHVNLRPGNTHIPDGLAPDAEAECRRYEDEIGRSGGIDLQVLGIGRNGHIGFNEPGTALGATTQLVRLHEDTIRVNSRDFGDSANVPRHAISMGVRTIMQARAILLLASGEEKAGIVTRALQGEVCSEVPASVLLLHPNLTVILDKPAAAGLERVPG